MKKSTASGISSTDELLQLFLILGVKGRKFPELVIPLIETVPVDVRVDENPEKVADFTMMGIDLQKQVLAAFQVNVDFQPFRRQANCLSQHGEFFQLAGYHV